MEFTINVFDLDGSEITITKDNFEPALGHLFMEAKIAFGNKAVYNLTFDPRIEQLERLNNIACDIANGVSVESSKGILYPEHLQLAESLIANINSKIVALRSEAIGTRI